MKVNVVVDSTADLRKGIENEVSVVPLTVNFGDEEFIDGVNITHEEFYKKLISSDLLPRTSQASPADFEKVFSEIAAKGESAIVLTLSSKLSGTYQSACIAAEEFENIYILDTCSVAIGSGLLVEMAITLAKEGRSAKEIFDILEEKKQNLYIVAVLDTLEYLKKGGRISSTVAFVGGMLSIKPVVCVRNGEIEMLGKARGFKAGNGMLLKEIEALGGIDPELPFIYGYTGLDSEPVKSFMKESDFLWKDFCGTAKFSVVGSVIGTHAGPGAVALAFFKK